MCGHRLDIRCSAVQPGAAWPFLSEILETTTSEDLFSPTAGGHAQLRWQLETYLPSLINAQLQNALTFVTAKLLPQAKDGYGDPLDLNCGALIQCRQVRDDFAISCDLDLERRRNPGAAIRSFPIPPGATRHRSGTRAPSAGMITSLGNSSRRLMTMHIGRARMAGASSCRRLTA